MSGEYPRPLQFMYFAVVALILAATAALLAGIIWLALRSGDHAFVLAAIVAAPGTVWCFAEACSLVGSSWSAWRIRRAAREARAP